MHFSQPCFSWTTPTDDACVLRTAGSRRGRPKACHTTRHFLYFLFFSGHWFLLACWHVNDVSTETTCGFGVADRRDFVRCSAIAAYVRDSRRTQFSVVACERNERRFFPPPNDLCDGLCFDDRRRVVSVGQPTRMIIWRRFLRILLEFPVVRVSCSCWKCFELEKPVRRGKECRWRINSSGLLLFESPCACITSLGLFFFFYSLFGYEQK